MARFQMPCPGTEYLQHVSTVIQDIGQRESIMTYIVPCRRPLHTSPDESHSVDLACKTSGSKCNPCAQDRAQRLPMNQQTTLDQTYIKSKFHGKEIINTMSTWLLKYSKKEVGTTDSSLVVWVIVYHQSYPSPRF